MYRLNSVKNTNFGFYKKKSFLTHSKTVFWVTENFCIKWTFWKNAFFRKMHFFEKNGNLIHWTAWDSAKGTFFWKVILYQFSKRKNWALLIKNVQAFWTLLNIALKVPFLEYLKKKVSKSNWNQRHIVYVTQIHYCTWF